MRSMVMWLLVMVLAIEAMPYLAYGQNTHRPDHNNDEKVQPVCVANLQAGTACESMTGKHQAMVMVRGQLLPVR